MACFFYINNTQLLAQLTKCWYNETMALDLHTLEQQLDALASERRLFILRYLKKNRTATVGKLAKALGISLQSTSQHLALLHAAGILERMKRGRFVSYRISFKQNDVVKGVVRGL